MRQIVRDPSTWIERRLGEVLVELQLVAGAIERIGELAVILAYTAEHATSLSGLAAIKTGSVSYREKPQPPSAGSSPMSPSPHFLLLSPVLDGTPDVQSEDDNHDEHGRDDHDDDRRETRGYEHH